MINLFVFVGDRVVLLAIRLRSTCRAAYPWSLFFREIQITASGGVQLFVSAVARELLPAHDHLRLIASQGRSDGYQKRLNGTPPANLCSL